MGAVTVVTSGKGGVGKSTVAVGVSSALAKIGRRVLLLDCDAGLSSLDRLTGVDKELVYDAADVVQGRCSPAEAIYDCPCYENLFLMPAPQSGEDAIRPETLKKLTDVLRRYYDYVILDSPAGVGMGFRAACMSADNALVVCNPEPVCVRSTGKVHRLLTELGLTEQRLVINRFDRKVFTALDGFGDLDAVIDEAQIRLIGLIPDDVRFVSSLINSKADERCRGVKACERIAARLEGEIVPLALE